MAHPPVQVLSPDQLNKIQNSACIFDDLDRCRHPHKDKTAGKACGVTIQGDNGNKWRHLERAHEFPPWATWSTSPIHFYAHHNNISNQEKQKHITNSKKQLS
jgi:hypothetical protein